MSDNLNDVINFPYSLVRNAIVLGVLYIIALYRFLRAFLFTDPVTIAVLGYSLPVFIIIFQMFFNAIFPDVKNIASAVLITIGCGILVYEEYKKEKIDIEIKKAKEKEPLYNVESHALDLHGNKVPVDTKNLEKIRHEFHHLKELFFSGNLDRYYYINLRNEFNKLLMEYSLDISGTIIRSIEIRRDSVLFVIEPLGLIFETDGAARSAPFEILNFGAYEPLDEEVCFKLLSDGDIIFDIGANIGWYAVNYSKRFPNSTVFSFEPIPLTFARLEKNLVLNDIQNCKPFMLGLGNFIGKQELFFFRSGSAIASIKNLIEHKKIEKVECSFTTLDEFVKENLVERIDFLKCDAEGSELYILQGAEKTINNQLPIIFIEIYEGWCIKCGYRPEDILQLLVNKGYWLFESIDGGIKRLNKLRSIDNGQYNYIFLHKIKHKELITKFSI